MQELLVLATFPVTLKLSCSDYFLSFEHILKQEMPGESAGLWDIGKEMKK